MLIGFSVDTDIVLTERMMKRKEGTPTQRLLSASKTGLTMAFSAIASMLALFIVSGYAGITVLNHIALILVVGLVGDLIATWCTNAVIVLWYLERKQAKTIAS